MHRIIKEISIVILLAIGFFLFLTIDTQSCEIYNYDTNACELIKDQNLTLKKEWLVFN